MRHDLNWGALVGGLVLMVIAAMFLVAALTPVHVPLVTVVPLLLVGLGLGAILHRRWERK